MKLYSNKLIWKIILILLASLLILASFVYLNNIIQKVNEKDKNRVERWATSVKRKAQLVELTNKTFEELRDKESEKVTLWAKASEELLSNIDLNSNCDLTFMTDILHDNKNIPVLLTDQNGDVINSINLDFPEDIPNFKDSVQHLVKIWGNERAPIKVAIGKSDYQLVYYSNSKKLRELEYKRDSLVTAFNLELVNNSSLVPVLFVSDVSNNIIASNLPDKVIGDSLSMHKKIEELKQINEPIRIDFSNAENGTIYYDESAELTKLKYFPIILFVVLALFILIGYLIFSTFRKAEQNQVWAGMAKETAHQLGTPISSLMAWTQLLEAKGTDPEDLREMDKDIKRLEKVADRFSKIGSKTVLEDKDIVVTIRSIYDYLQARTPSKVQFDFNTDDESLHVMHSPALFEWVIENLCKNAVDAMKADGHLSINLSTTETEVIIDVKDTGAGIPPNKLKTVFSPGYTTKKRGWGLGLSLVKRIIDEYHKGKIFVYESQEGVGTTFRIKLKK